MYAANFDTTEQEQEQGSQSQSLDEGKSGVGAEGQSGRCYSRVGPKYASGKLNRLLVRE